MGYQLVTLVDNGILPLMPITKTNFEYPTIERVAVNNKRHYSAGNQLLPSVTTILSATASSDKEEKLNNWRQRVGHKAAAQITDEAANVGTIMHEVLEHWVKNEEYNPGNNMIHRIGKAMAKTVVDNISADLNEVWGSEVNLYYPGLYAGTTDLVGVWKGKETIMDFKQTNKPKKVEWIDDYFIQGVSYAMAHNELFGTNIKRVAIFMCSRDLQFQLFEIDTDEVFTKWEDQWLDKISQYYSQI